MRCGYSRNAVSDTINMRCKIPIPTWECCRDPSLCSLVLIETQTRVLGEVEKSSFIVLAVIGVTVG